MKRVLGRGIGLGLSLVLAACGGSVVEGAPEEDSSVDSALESAPPVETGGDDTSIDDSSIGEDTAIDDTGSDDTGADTTVVDSGSDTGASDSGSDSFVADSGSDTFVADTGSDTGKLDTGTDTGTDTGFDAGVPILSDILTPSAASCSISACGRWTFGSAPSSTGTLTAFPSFTYRSYPSYAADGGPLKWWADTSTSTLPMVMYNTGADTPYHPTKKVTVHPGNSGVNAIVEWVAPASANYKITGSFVGKDTGSRLVRVLVVGGSTLLDQTLTGTATVPIAITSVAITAGQKIRFAVDPNGVMNNDTTQIDAQLEWAAPSPCTAASDGAACGSNMHCCGGACVANASALTCGASSCTACTVPAHSYSTCSGTACGFACSQGYGDCNTTPGDGCERPITNDVNNCGGCNTKCATPAATMHQSPTCTGTTCGVACNTGYGDCNTTPGDGCERPITNDVNNCGGCNTKCATPAATMHQSPTCTGTTCGVACNIGFLDCDLSAANGCECGAGMNQTASCSGATCNLVCDPGWADCDGLPGCETNTNSDPSNCGFCFNACPTWTGSVCLSGHCS